jgi:hypothetical protein
MFAGIPLSLALGFDPYHINPQMQRPGSTTGWDGDVQYLLTAAQGAEVWHFPVKPCQAQEASNKPGRLPKGHPERYLHRQTKLDRRVAELGLTPPFASRRRMPRNLGIKPD